MKKMTLTIVALILPIMFTGCNPNQFEEKPLHDVMTSHTWYEIDQTRDRYVKHEFSDTGYVGIKYASEKFAEEIGVTNGYIVEYNKDSVKINVDGVTHTCNLCGDEEIGYEIMDCDAVDGSLTECDTLWKNRSLAFKNSATQKTKDY